MPDAGRVPIVTARRLIARAANAGLVIFGLALVIVIGTGGTRIEPLGIGLRRVGNPLVFFALSAALRLLVASRRRGVEALVVRFFARQGLPPRDGAATPLAAARTGMLLGAGMGLSVAVPDALHLLLTEPPPPPSLGEALAVLAIAGPSGLALGAFAGALAGPCALLLARLGGRRPGRYVVGRVTLALLWLGAALWVRAAPYAPREAHTPAVLLTVTLAFALSAGGAFLLVPAAILRARRGRWGLTVIAGGTLASLIGLAGVASIGTGAEGGSGGEAGHPNVLLVSITGLRADAAGLLGEAPSVAPNLEALATRGVLLEEAVTPATETLPAAISLLTAAYPDPSGGRAGAPPPEALGDVLAAHGYATAAFVSDRMLDGRVSILGSLFGRYDDASALRDRLKRLSVARAWLLFDRRPHRHLRPADETAAAFAAWVSRLPRTPWLAWVEFADPLRSLPVPVGEGARRLTVGAWFEAGGGLDLSRPLARPPSWSAEGARSATLAEWMHGYEVAVGRADAGLGALLRAVELRGETHRTVIAVVSEHGVALGENGAWFEAGPGAPEPVLRVPWVVAGAGIPPGGAVPGPSSLVDVAPTLLGLVGLSGSPTWEGEDLSRYLLAAGAARRERRPAPVFSMSAPDPRYGGGRWVVVRRGPWKLVRFPDGSERLYFVEDSLEGEVPAIGGRVARERRALSDLLNEHLALRQGMPPRRR